MTTDWSIGVAVQRHSPRDREHMAFSYYSSRLFLPNPFIRNRQTHNRSSTLQARGGGLLGIGNHRTCLVDMSQKESSSVKTSLYA